MPKRVEKALCDRPVAARARRASTAPCPRANSSSVSGASASGSTRRLAVPLPLALIGFPHTDDAIRLAPSDEDADPHATPHPPIGDEAVLAIVETYVHDIQPADIGQHLGPECQGHAML